MHIVMLDPTTPEALARMAQYLPSGWRITTAASRLPADQLAALKAADYAIAGDVPVTAEMMAAKTLKAVHKWGVGFDNIDLQAARASGVRVLRTTGSNAVTVAETTLGLILALNRNIVRGHMGIDEGEWLKSAIAPDSRRLSGRKIGIIGFGYIGTALAKLLKGFGCEIVYNKRTPLSPEQEAETGAKYSTLEELLRTSDVVTLNCELNDSTRNLINATTLALMQPDAILVNVARGGVMDEQAVADAVEAGRLRGAAVDVFEVEPILPDNPLAGIDRIITTPHLGAISADNYVPSITRMMRNLQALSEGGQPDSIDILV